MEGPFRKCEVHHRVWGVGRTESTARSLLKIKILYTYIHRYVYAYVYIYIHICIYICICTQHVQWCIHIQIYNTIVHISKYMHIQICLYVYMYAVNMGT